MPRFLAVTSAGLAETLLDELKGLGVKNPKQIGPGVEFDSNWEGCYKLNLHVRTATRIVMPILDFPAYNGEDLYHNLLKHDFTKYIETNETLSIEASTVDSAMRDQRYIAMKAKDAIVDQFRDKFGVRPDVQNKNPDLLIFIKVVKNQVHVAIDTSGDSLFKRGYRREVGVAPVKEHLAAGLLRISGWTPDMPVIDPMCGSGTFLIEAALMALNIAPGTLRHEFGFQKMKGYDKEAFEKVVTETLDNEKAELPFKFYGFDKDGDCIKAARINASEAGVADFIEFKKQQVSLFEPPAEKGIIIVNPPYGERLNDEVVDSYKDLSFALKSRFKGWTCWMLSGHQQAGDIMGLKSARKYQVYNGPIECRFLKYEIRH